MDSLKILEKTSKGLIDYGIVDSEEDGYDLAADIESAVREGDAKRASQEVEDYLVDVYGYKEKCLDHRSIYDNVSRIIFSIQDMKCN